MSELLKRQICFLFISVLPTVLIVGENLYESTINLLSQSKERVL